MMYTALEHGFAKTEVVWFGSTCESRAQRYTAMPDRHTIYYAINIHTSSISLHSKEHQMYSKRLTHTCAQYTRQIHSTYVCSRPKNDIPMLAQSNYYHMI